MRNGVLENLGAWKLFIRVAGFRSFRSAAKALDEDPSVVSRRIAQLESALGFRLFDTSGQSLVLTENGRRDSFISSLRPAFRTPFSGARRRVFA